jgi:hypothetical protein
MNGILHDSNRHSAAAYKPLRGFVSLDIKSSKMSDRHCLASGIFGMAVSIACLPTWAAQPSAVQPSVRTAPAEVGESFTAIRGQPFGVAALTIPIGVVEAGRLPRVLVSDAEKRVFYPAVSLEEMAVAPSAETVSPRPILRGGLIDRLRNALDNAEQQRHPPSLLRIQFLFQGTQPLTLHLDGDLERTLVIDPQPWEQAEHRSQLERWWEGYCRQASLQFSAGDYPPGIEAYLTSMLASRLELPPSRFQPVRPKVTRQSDPQPTIELLAGTDRIRGELMMACLERPAADRSSALVAVPTPGEWQALPVPEGASIPTIESIARHVPPECFYLRFGSFSNALWFQEINKGKGDGLAQMLMRRGLDYQAHQRLERMLNAKTTLLAKWFGDSLISDMALIGYDLYLQEGPAVGVLFESPKPELLRGALDADRESTRRKFAAQGMRLDRLTIGDAEVSWLSSPDQSVRSLLVQQGKYLLVTTSQHLVRRFLEVERGQASLADQPIFRQMRRLMPLDHDYAVFAFFSPEFFQSLLSPQYQIELRRRLRAVARLQLADMASLCARGEKSNAHSLEGLIAEGFLPQWFLEASHDSRPVRSGDRWVDSRRGGRGHLIPIPDVTVESCTAEEAEEYQRLSDYYTHDWPQTDPLVLGLRRFVDEADKNVEQVAVEAYVAPFGREKYGWLSFFLAPPVETQISLPPDDVLQFQAHLSGKNILNPTPVPDHVLFGGVKDMNPPPPHEDRRWLETLIMLQRTPAYLGAWPLPGYLDRLPLALGGGPPDALGFSKLLIGAWRWQGSGFSVLSFDRQILESCMLSLKPSLAEDPAQVRLRLGDLEPSQVKSWINTFWFRRALQASRGNLWVMDTIQSQFHLPAAEAKATAERLCDGRLVCPLGGDYELSEDAALPHWRTSYAKKLAAPRSSAGVDERRTPQLAEMGLALEILHALPPAEYQAPWLGWMRGAELHLTQLAQQLILVGRFRLQKLPPPREVPLIDESALPQLDFNLFTAPFQFFQSPKPKGEGSQDRPPPSARGDF